MAIRAKLLEAKQVCMATSGEQIDIGIYQGMQSGFPSLQDPRAVGVSSIILRHPSGRSVDVTDLVDRGTIAVL